MGEIIEQITKNIKRIIKLAHKYIFMLLYSLDENEFVIILTKQREKNERKEKIPKEASEKTYRW